MGGPSARWEQLGVRDLRGYLTVSICLASVLLCQFPISAQVSDDSSPAKPQKEANQKPIPVHDLTGIWAARAPIGEARKSGYSSDEQEDGGWWNFALRSDQLPMTAWAEAKFKSNRASFGPNKVENSNDPAYGCFPPGVPRVYASIGAGMQIIERPNLMLMLFGTNVRQIYTDGRSHPKNARPLWMGHSIGTWNGDVFTVDTVDFVDRTWIDRMGHPHSNELHLIERFRRSAYNTLDLEMTVDDPKAYTVPWTATKSFQLRPPSVRAGGGACEDIFINPAFGLKPMLPSR